MTTVEARIARACAVAAVALAYGATNPTHAADYVMKFSTPTINELQHAFLKRYEEELEQRTDGAIDVQLYPASQLGPISSVLEGLQLGTIEASITPAELYVGVDPRFQIPAVPGLFDSMEDARATFDDPEVREHLLNVATDKGIKGFALLVYGPQTINTLAPAEDIDALSGRRIRVLASETETGAVDALGAAAVPMPLNEVSAALQQGAIDGLSTVVDVFVALKTNDVAPHILDTRLWYLNSIAAVSQAWLDSLPEDLQVAVQETGADLEAEMFQWQIEKDKENRAIWEEQGGTITPLSDEDRAEAEAAVAEVTEQFIEGHPELRETYDLLAGAGQD